MPPTGCQRAAHCLWYTGFLANICRRNKGLQLTRGRVPNLLNLDLSIWYKVGVFKKKMKLGMAYIHMVRFADIYVSTLHLLTDGYPVPH